MILKDNKLKNPYNRNNISMDTINIIKKKLEYNKIMNVNEIIVKSTKPDFISLFQIMDELGNITMVEWLTELSPKLLRIFIIELHDIWNYRAGLNINNKKELCPPHGNPFINTPIHSILQKKYKPNSDILYQYIHNIFCILLHNENSDQESKKVCSIHILIALTLVNQDAANALPWLYNSSLYN